MLNKNVGHLSLALVSERPIHSVGTSTLYSAFATLKVKGDSCKIKAFASSILTSADPQKGYQPATPIKGFGLGRKPSHLK
jgi:hypothetical protein